jgi:hypothetical protein
MTKQQALPDPIAAELIEQKIFLARGQRVMIDSDLANLYGVPTRVLNQAVRRNRKRFPDDFMFQLTAQEYAELNRSQIVTGSQKHRDPRYRPYAFNEHGAVMLASVLNSAPAISASIQVVRAFIKMRSFFAAHKELAKRLEKLEKSTTLNFIEIYKFINDYRKANRQLPSAIGFRHTPNKK